MRTAAGGGRRARAVGVLLLAALGVAPGSRVRAQSPQSPTLQQLDHTAWTTRDGAPNDVVALAQSADGVLWLGSTAGLFRFDGVRFERFEPSPGERLASPNVTALLAEPDGRLWVGYTFGGASVLRGGHLTHYGAAEGLPPNTLNQFARDSTGGLWAATSAGLHQLQGGRWRRVGAERALPDTAVASVLVDRRGTVWASTLAGVYALVRGAPGFVRRAPSLGDGNGTSLREAPDGSVWGASLTDGLTRLSDAAGDRAPPGPRRGPGGAYALLVTDDGAAWLAARAGITRLPPAALRTDRPAPAGRVDAAERRTRAEGLSDNRVVTFLQDREGTVWVGTAGGLDRFRPTKLTRVALPADLVSPAVWAGARGTAWVGSMTHPPFAIGADLPRRRSIRWQVTEGVQCAYRDPDGALWLGGQGRLWRAATTDLTATPPAPVALPPALAGRFVQAIAHDADGTLWLSGVQAGVFRRRGGVWSRFAAAPGGGASPATVIVADGFGRHWLGYPHDRLALVTGDSVRVFTGADGPRVGTVTAVHVRGDHVWVGGESGVARFVAGRFQSVVPQPGVDLLGVSGIVETADGELWLNGAGGVTRLPAAELARAAREPRYRVRAERFDYHDGVEGGAPQIRPLPSAIAGTDGRLWFTTATGVLAIDPAHVRRNGHPPPVQIRLVAAAGRTHAPAPSGDTVRLPPRTTALRITYTALSLAVPDRVRFRYRLEGSDPGWQDAGTRREAFYTNLGPGTYRFRVRASNDDGVWNAAGATVDVVIPPTFVQSTAFAALCVTAAGAAGWLLLRWRHRRTTAALRATFAVTLAERTRIAQELHDTLLQGFTGVTAQLYAVRRVLPDSPVAATLAHALATADATLRDARHAVWDMRSPELAALDLPEALEAAAREACAGTPLRVRLTVRGARVPLPPPVATAAFRIGREAVVNAVRHADARTITLDVAYEEAWLTLRVRDDGRGLAPGAADDARREGHWGVVGMRERARGAGGTLDLAPAPGGGTRVTLALPLDAAR